MNSKQLTSVWLLLLPLRDQFRYMRGFTLERASLMSFSQQSLLLLLVFMSSIPKTIAHKELTKKTFFIFIFFLAITGYFSICSHQNVQSVVVLMSCCWTWLCWSSMISSICCLNSKRERLSHPCWIWCITHIQPSLSGLIGRSHSAA